MVTLKVALDASGMATGARQAVTNLDTVTAAAERGTDALDIYGLTGTRIWTQQETAARAAAESIRRVREQQEAASRATEAAAERVRNFNRAAGAATEVVSTSARVRLLGEEVRNLGSGFSSAASIGTLFGASLIDVAQAGIRAEGGLKGVIGLLRSQPLLAAGVVLTGISTAMALFGSQTRDTNTELEKQIQLQQELKRASLDLALQIQRDKDLRSVGFPIDEQAAGLARSRRLTEVASSLAGQQGFQSFSDLQTLTGLSRQQLRLLAPEGGIETRVSFEQSRRTLGRQVRTEEELGLTNEAARRVLLLLAENIKANSDLLPGGLQGGTGPVAGRLAAGSVEDPYRAALSDFQRGAPQPNLDSVGLSGPTPFGPPIDFEQLRRNEQAQADFNRELERTRQLGIEVGTALGNSFFSFLQNARDARGVLVGLLQQLSQIAQSRIVSGFANAVGNAFAPTPAQQQTTIRTPGEG